MPPSGARSAEYPSGARSAEYPSGARSAEYPSGARVNGGTSRSGKKKQEQIGIEKLIDPRAFKKARYLFIFI